MTAAGALGCQACGLAITPCLVCANPLPIHRVDDLLMKTCSGCGAVNPLCDKYREVLDIPPTLALPPAMVRRAQIAHVGRRPYILAKHAHFMHLSSGLNKKKGEDEEDGGSGSHSLASWEISEQLMPKGSPIPEIFASVEEGHPLTFLPYMQDTGLRRHGESACADRKAVDARHFYPFSDFELSVKRISVTIPYHCGSSSCQDIENVEKNLRRCMHPTPHQAQGAPNNGSFVAALSNGPSPNICTVLKNDFPNLGEATGKMANGLGLSAEPQVQSIHSAPFITKCDNDPRATMGDVDGGEVRCSADGGQNSNPLDGPLENSTNVVEREVCGAKQLDTSKTEPYVLPIRSTIHRLDSFKEVLESPLVERVPLNTQGAEHREGEEVLVSVIVVSSGSVEEPPHKYLEHEESVKQLSTSRKKVDTEDEVDALEHEDHNNHVRDVTGSEEVPTHRHGRVCSECGQTREGLGRVSPDEVELMRCCTQILELHCPHALKVDMHSPCLYPLCCPTPRYPVPAGATSSSNGCQSQVTQFTIDLLRTAHSTLTSSTQESTSEEVMSPLRGVEQALLMAEKFMEIKDEMGAAQGLILQVEAASAQASRDLKAYADRGAFPLGSRLIPSLLIIQKQHTVDRAKHGVEMMTSLLQDINKILTTCFQYVAKILETSLSLVGDNHPGSYAVNLDFFMLEVDNKPALEAVRIAVPLWLRLYHDVAHACGLLK